MLELTDLVTVKKAKSYDSWGVSILSDNADEVSCKIMYNLKNEPLLNSKGNLVGISANIYLEGLYPIGMYDEVKFVDDFGVSHTLEALNIKPIKDFTNKVLYTKVTV